MSNNNSNLKTNTISLQELLNTVNNLPSAGSGGTELPELTNEGAASDLLSGKQLINGRGNVVTGIIKTKTDTDLTASGAVVNVPAGYYATQVSKSVDTVTRAETTMTVSADDSNNKLTITASNNQNTGYVTGANKTATKIITLTASGANVTASDGTNSISATVQSGSIDNPTFTIEANDPLDTKLHIQAKINEGYINNGYAEGEFIFTEGVGGVYYPTIADQIISEGAYVFDKVTIKGDVNLVSENIRAGTELFNITGSFTQITPTLEYAEGSTVEVTCDQGQSGKNIIIIEETLGDATFSTPLQATSEGLTFYITEIKANNDRYQTSTLYLTEPLAQSLSMGDPIYISNVKMQEDLAVQSSDIVQGKIGYINGVKVIGTMPNNGDVSITMDGIETKNITIPAGYTDGGTVSLDDTIDNEAVAQSDLIDQIIATANSLPEIGSGEPTDDRDLYQRVEYITSAEEGTYPYIITDFIADNTCGLEVIASFSAMQDRIPMGSRTDGSTATRFYCAYPLSTTSVYYGFNGGSSISCSTSVNTIYRLQTNFLNSRLVNVYEEDGTRKASASLNATLAAQNVPVSIFGYHSGSSGAVSSKREYKLYSARCSRGHEVVREYIPCYRKSDGVVGLYEKFSGQFLTDASGSANGFTKGAEIDW